MPTATPTASPAFVAVHGSGRVIFWTALICGTMDISAAFISANLMSGVGPALVLRSVASALLGPDVRDGDSWAVGAFGLALHYAIATGWTVLFYRLSRRWPVLTRQPVWSGLLYGTFVYVCMNLIVVQAAFLFRRLYVHLPTAYAYAPRLSWVQFFIILGCIGLPIAFSVRWLTRGERRAG